MTSIYLEKRIPARNQQRFYAIHVVETRFGAWTRVREWGRIGQPGTVWETEFETEGAARAAGEQWRQRKEKRGYKVISTLSRQRFNTHEQFRLFRHHHSQLLI
jgi:predicted DNA-binding WGR domain protein